jgi:hypothetical protein
MSWINDWDIELPLDRKKEREKVGKGKEEMNSGNCDKVFFLPLSQVHLYEIHPSR